MQDSKRNNNNEPPKEKKKRSLSAYLLVGFILFLILASIALNYNVIVKWMVVTPPIVITLNHPTSYEVIYNESTYFNWTGVGGDGTPLQYVWYADVTNTFNSPFARVIPVGLISNYTALPFEDGDWYWRVEGTDGTIVNVSEIWRFTILNFTTNIFPELNNASVTPESGTTAVTYVYDVTYKDQDNNSASYVRIYIDGNPFNMVEVDPADINSSDGKDYTYSTLLAIGLHNYSIFCYDGYAVYHTPLVYKPSVTNVTGGGGTIPGGGGGLGGVKQNKLTIQPDNTISYPTGQFTGDLVITQEGEAPVYEVYWYIYLVDANGTQLNGNSGAVALDTTVTVSYDIPVFGNTSLGAYQLMAKTYDLPREQIASVQIGMDTVDVTVEKQPIGLSIYDFLLLNTWLLIILMVLALALAIIAWKKKKGYILVFAVGISMMLLVVFHIVQFHYFSFIGILFTMLGGFLFTKSFQKLFNIKRFKLVKFTGAMLILLGVLLYFKMLW